MGNHSSVKHLPAPCSALLSLCRPGRSSPLLPSTAGIPAPETWKLCQGIRACAVSCGSGRPQRKVAGHSLSFLLLVFSLVQFSRSVVSDSLRPHESQHARPPCPSPTPRVYSNSYPSSRRCHLAISSSVVPFSSCPPNPSQHQSFPMSQLFA